MLVHILGETLYESELKLRLVISSNLMIITLPKLSMRPRINLLNGNQQKSEDRPRFRLNIYFQTLIETLKIAKFKIEFIIFSMIHMS